MTNNEAIFLWIAVWLYGISFLFFLFGLLYKKDKVLGWGWYLAVAGFMPHNISMAIRWVIIGHPPVMRSYENSMLSAWFVLALFFLIRRWQRSITVIGVVLMPVVLLMIGRGVMGSPYLEPMSPPFKSNWLWLHVFFAWSAYGAFCIAAGLGVIYLLKEMAESGGRTVDFYERLPNLDVLNELILRTITFGFISLTVEIGAGALWAYNLWGRYWGWDPIETWSLITWLVYGIVIHLGVTLGWKGRSMAWLAILSLISVFVTFGGIGYFTSVHTTLL